MTKDIFVPPPVPLCSKALVATLKRRIYEAIETGKASDAKIFLDIIERLARMAWLDDKPQEERDETENLRRTRVMGDVDRNIVRLLHEQELQEAAQRRQSQAETTANDVPQGVALPPHNGALSVGDPADYFSDVQAYAAPCNAAAITGIVAHLDTDVAQTASPLISFSDPEALDAVRENFLVQTLGLADNDKLDGGIAAVMGRLGENASQQRVTFLYLLADHFGKLDMFVKKPDPTLIPVSPACTSATRVRSLSP